MSHVELPNLENLSPFEAHTVKELAELKTDMKSLVGNGQPGRVAILEGRVLKLAIGLVAIAAYEFGPKILTWALGL